MNNSAKELPLKGIKVIAFTHAVMGPSAGLILADLGAEVIHIEPPTGDMTRGLKGFGIGYFAFFNRNKKSVAVDLKGEVIGIHLKPGASIKDAEDIAHAINQHMSSFFLTSFKG